MFGLSPQEIAVLAISGGLFMAFVWVVFIPKR